MIDTVSLPMFATQTCRLSFVTATTCARAAVKIDAIVSMVSVSMTETRPEARFVANSRLPSRVRARSWVEWPRASMVPIGEKVTASITEMLFELSLAT